MTTCGLARLLDTFTQSGSEFMAKASILACAAPRHMGCSPHPGNSTAMMDGLLMTPRLHATAAIATPDLDADSVASLRTCRTDPTMGDRKGRGRRAAHTATVWLGGLVLATGFSVALLSGTAHADSPSDSDSRTSSSVSERGDAEDADDRTPGRDHDAEDKAPDSEDPARADGNTTDSTPDNDSTSDDSDDSSEEESPASDKNADSGNLESEDSARDSDDATPPHETAPEVEQPRLRDPAAGLDGESRSHDRTAATERLDTGGESATPSPAALAPPAAPTLNTSANLRLGAPTAAAAPPSLTALTPPQAVQALLAWAGQELRTALAAPWQNPQFTAAIAQLEQQLNDFFAGFNPAAYPPPGPAPIPPPSASDVVSTPFGDLGKWMLRPVPPPPTAPPGAKPTYVISDWLNQQYGGRQLLEPINVVIVDRTSTTAEESTQKLITTLGAAGFPIRVQHSTGYVGHIDGDYYDQTPDGKDQAFSNCFYVFPNDHARFFGPAPAPLPDGTGFVWTAALSREQVGIYDWSFTHRYVSFQQARNTLRDNLLHNGATDLGMISLENAVNSPTQFTGDHDGYAVVVQIT